MWCATWAEPAVANILYLVHRLPYPPNKGDKVRSCHLLKHLAQQHRVFLGTFVDDPADQVHVPVLRALCAEVLALNLVPRWARLRSLSGLFTGQALSLPYYRDARLQAWVDQILATEKIDAVVIFSSVMAQYTTAASTPQAASHAAPITSPARVPQLVDFVDVDSLKWAQYAKARPWPWSWLYRREARCLLAFDRAVARRARRAYFVTQQEADLFIQLAPECRRTVQAMGNGVDLRYFSVDALRPSPFPVSPRAPTPPVHVVFTGAMDYWPNVDAVIWFARSVLPALRKSWPQLVFYIVGRSPPSSVQALEGEGVVVTGTVADVRTYLQHADVVVAPLRVARGIQNKILEAMAMARPVVASCACAQAMTAQLGVELLAAHEPQEFVREISALLRDPARAQALGQAARLRVVQSYSWEAHLAALDQQLPTPAVAEVLA